MDHAPGPARRRQPYSPSAIAKIWKRGKPLTSQWSSKRAIKDPREWRRDFFGYPIRFGAYGDRDSLHGWEVAPLVIRSRDGTKTTTLLRPLHWLSILKLI